MEYDVEYTETFESWWSGLSEAEQKDIAAVIELLEKLGPHLPFPYSSRINGSKHREMRELRIQHRGKPYRTLYAFDPRRAAILLIGGNKTGDKRWYSKHIAIADALFDQHVKRLGK
jgi:hypothetical protein